LRKRAFDILSSKTSQFIQQFEKHENRSTHLLAIESLHGKDQNWKANFLFYKAKISVSLSITPDIYSHSIMQRSLKLRLPHSNNKFLNQIAFSS